MHRLGHWPSMDSDGRPPPDPARALTPPSRHSFLDGEKTGAVLLLSGAVLALVGVTFTVMGWKHYQTDRRFKWTQLLGPVLISAGGTFILTSVCKFCVISCWPCARLREEEEEEAFGIPMRPQTARDGQLTFQGTTEPVALQSSTTILCIPPPYNFISQEARRPACSVNGLHPAALPPYDAVCCAENAAFAAEAGSTETDQRRRSSTQKTEEGTGPRDGSGSTCSRPPAYEDIYPSFEKRGAT